MTSPTESHRSAPHPHATVDTMLAGIEERLSQTAHHTGRSALSRRVHQALHAVLRESFIPPEIKQFAYIPHPLPIGNRQTMPEPFVVAVMTELLDLRPEDSVLEIGTGSGWQTAILAKLARQVYSIELVPQLAARARAVLQHLNYANVTLHAADGAIGWPEHAPYDAILVTVPVTQIPNALIDQLRIGGRLVAPVGPKDADQILTVVVKPENGRVTRTRLLPVHLDPHPHPQAAAHHPDPG